MSKNKKQNFRKTWRTFTELGQEFGMSAIKFGKLLKEHGLREPTGEPTKFAEGCFQKVEPKGSHPYYLWHHEKVCEYLVSKGIEKSGVSAKEASAMTEARKLARGYLEAQKLNEGSKLGYMMFADMVDEIKKIGIDIFNQALKTVGYKGDPVTLEGWE
jgi:hypothetical protein